MDGRMKDEGWKGVKRGEGEGHKGDRHETRCVYHSTNCPFHLIHSFATMQSHFLSLRGDFFSPIIVPASSVRERAPIGAHRDSLCVCYYGRCCHRRRRSLPSPTAPSPRSASAAFSAACLPTPAPAPPGPDRVSACLVFCVPDSRGD